MKLTQKYTATLRWLILGAGTILFLIGAVAGAAAVVAEHGHDVASPLVVALLFLLALNAAPAGLGLYGLHFVILAWGRRKRGESMIDWSRLPSLVAMLKPWVSVVLLIMVLAAGAGAALFGYTAYEFTETVGFCGEVCHAPMSPQLAAHRDSPHAKVACTECHVGPGIFPYAKAKLAGMRVTVTA